MASRNRGNRQAPLKDDAADEERSLWSQLVLDAKRIDALVVRSLQFAIFCAYSSQAQHNFKWNRMQELKTTIEEQHGITPVIENIKVQPSFPKAKTNAPTHRKRRCPLCGP